MTHTSEAAARKPLRLWPGVFAVALQWLVWAVVPLAVPEEAGVGVMGGIVGGALVLIWWLFFSRAPWLDRIGAPLVMVLAVLAAKRIVHISIANGAMGMMLPVFSVPPLSLALVASAAAGRRLSNTARRTVMFAAILVAVGAFAFVRTDGVTGAGGFQLRWRWSPTAEERLLARSQNEAAVAPAAQPGPRAGPPTAAAAPAGSAQVGPGVSMADKPAAASGAESKTTPAVDSTAAADPAPRLADWPGFRGPRRDGVIHGVQLETDWTQHSPAELWRRPIGPGWSSFAVDGSLIYTHEQRGDHEVVSCHRLADGKVVWQHRDAVRFYESNGGPGPRATPAVRNGRVYTLGATGLLNALDARTGKRLWSRNAQADTGAPLPGWGFTGSPLAIDDAVVVATSGRLAAYDPTTGQPRWTRQTGAGGYSSPHLATIHGVDQVLLLSGGGGVTSVSPDDGTVLWQLPWQEGVSIVQPAVLSGSDVIAIAGDMMGGQGMRRISVSRQGTAWRTEERWTTRGLKPYFSDFVVHEGHAYGFDGTILACIDLETGERRWKGGRYGAGQMLLIADQDLLLVVAEEGELALVQAAPDKHSEVARFKAIEGKTWNHPVLVRDVLLVRNGEEAAAFRLPVRGN